MKTTKTIEGFFPPFRTVLQHYRVGRPSAWGCGIVAVGLMLAPSSLAAQITAKGMVIPLFVGAESKPTALVRVKELRNDYRRVGFFRIGAIPLVVLDGVTIELKHTNHLSSSLKELPKGVFLNKHPNLLEARDVRIIATTETVPRLQARTMRFLNGVQWRFFDGILFAGSNHSVYFSEGTLQLEGPKQGCFTYKAGGTAEALELTVDLLAPGACGAELP